MFRSSPRPVRSWLLAAVLGLGAVSAPHVPAVDPPSPRQDARSSCKPMPPVTAAIEPGASPGSWRVRLVAYEAVPAVEVWFGAGDASAPNAAWRGSLAPGETRTLDLVYRPRPGASFVWVEPRTGPGAPRRRALFALEAAKPASEATGLRTSIDPESGLPVVEAVGVVGSGR